MQRKSSLSSMLRCAAMKFPQQNKSCCFVVLRTLCRNQECEIHHAQQENFSLTLVANLTQSWPFIPLVLIIAELLPKITKSEQKKLSNRKQILNKNGDETCCDSLALRSRFAHAHYGSQMIDRFLYWGDHRNQKCGEIKGNITT